MPVPELENQEFLLARYIRDPQHAPAPPGIEERRLAIYRELFYNNVEGLLAGNFPVIRKIFNDQQWNDLIREFYREFRCQTPFFPELAREFIKFLEARAQTHGDQQPWLAELAHYEWVELALDLAEEQFEATNIDSVADWLSSPIRLSPLAWALAYEWPVHRLGPDYQPTEMPGNPTFLLVQIDQCFEVRFKEIDALTYLLIEQVDQNPDLNLEQHLYSLAEHTGAAVNPEFIQRGQQLISQLIRAGIVLGPTEKEDTA